MNIWIVAEVIDGDAAVNLKAYRTRALAIAAMEELAHNEAISICNPPEPSDAEDLEANLEEIRTLLPEGGTVMLSDSYGITLAEVEVEEEGP